MTDAEERFAERLAKVEVQLARYSSDLESEKRTRANVNKDVEIRLRVIERYLAYGIGGLGVLQIVSLIITITKLMK